MKRWIHRWNAYWFPTTSTVPLAICRILMVAARLFWLTRSMSEQYNLLERNSAFITPQLLIRAVAAVVPRDMLFTPSGFHALYWITVVAGVLALIGLFTRVSLFVFALANWIFIAHLYSYADIHHPRRCSPFCSCSFPSPRRVTACRSTRGSVGARPPPPAGRRRPINPTWPCGHSRRRTR